MKKLSIVAMALMIGASIAYPASLAVPWFVDNAAAGSGIPQSSNGVTAVINLKSTIGTPLTCYISYYNAVGTEVGPFAPNNSFVIEPKAAVAFRPVIVDPSGGVTNPVTGEVTTTGGGQESEAGVVIPDRPLSYNVTSGTYPPGVDPDSETATIQGKVWTLIDRAGDGTTPYQDPIPEGFTDWELGYAPTPTCRYLWDSKQNGSITISWEGAATDLQGRMTSYQVSDATGETLTMSFSHLLPTGKEE